MAARGSSREFIQRPDGTFGGSRPGVPDRDVSTLRAAVLDGMAVPADDPDFPRDAWESDRATGVTDLGYGDWVTAQWAQVNADMTAIAEAAHLADPACPDIDGF